MIQRLLNQATIQQFNELLTTLVVQSAPLPFHLQLQMIDLFMQGPTRGLETKNGPIALIDFLRGHCRSSSFIVVGKLDGYMRSAISTHIHIHSHTMLGVHIPEKEPEVRIGQMKVVVDSIHGTEFSKSQDIVDRIEGSTLTENCRYNSFKGWHKNMECFGNGGGDVRPACGCPCYCVVHAFKPRWGRGIRCGKDVKRDELVALFQIILKVVDE